MHLIPFDMHIALIVRSHAACTIKSLFLFLWLCSMCVVITNFLFFTTGGEREENFLISLTLSLRLERREREKKVVYLCNISSRLALFARFLHLCKSFLYVVVIWIGFLKGKVFDVSI